MRGVGRELAGQIALAQLPGAFVPLPGLGGAHLLREIEPLEARPAARFRNQRINVERAILAMRDHRVGRAQFPDAPRDGAGVDAGHADPAPIRQPLVERLGSAEVRRRGDGLGHHAAQRVRVDGLDILGVRPHIADMREGEGDDLPGVAGVGHHFLVAGHRGVEAELANGLAFGAGTSPLKDGAIGQHNDSCRAGWLARGMVVGHWQILVSRVSG